MTGAAITAVSKERNARVRLIESSIRAKLLPEWLDTRPAGKRLESIKTILLNLAAKQPEIEGRNVDFFLRYCNMLRFRHARIVEPEMKRQKEARSKIYKMWPVALTVGATALAALNAPWLPVVIAGTIIVGTIVAMRMKHVRIVAETSRNIQTVLDAITRFEGAAIAAALSIETSTANWLGNVLITLSFLKEHINGQGEKFGLDALDGDTRPVYHNVTKILQNPNSEVAQSFVAQTMESIARLENKVNDKVGEVIGSASMPLKELVSLQAAVALATNDGRVQGSLLQPSPSVNGNVDAAGAEITVPLTQDSTLGNSKSEFTGLPPYHEEISRYYEGLAPNKL